MALERDPALRDEIARAIPVPSVVAWSRVRVLTLALALAPLLMLLELDRELVTRDLHGTGRLLVGILLTAYVVFELTRKTPRLPGVAAAALLAVSMRWLLVVTRHCGRSVHPAVWGAAALAVVSGLLLLARAPSRARVALELLDRLGIARSEAEAVKRERLPRGALILAACLAAAGLPLLLWALRRSGAELWAQALAFVAYGTIVPELVRVKAGGEPPLDAPGGEPPAVGAPAREPPAVGAPARTSPSARERAERARPPARIKVTETLFAIALGLTLTAALLHGTHHFFDAGGELARCAGRLDDASRRLLAAEAAELSRRLANVRSSSMLVLMTTAVIPLVEERLYRGVLMKVLVQRYGLTYGVFASAAAFGVAHVGSYELALYQTVLLGIGFGLAYAEGGLIAAFAVHAVWNLLSIA